MRDIIVLSEFSSFTLNAIQLIKSLPESGRIIWVNLCCDRSKQITPLQHSVVDLDIDSCSDITLDVHIGADIGCATTKQVAINAILDSLRPILTKYCISQPIIWAANNLFGELVKHIEGASLVYYCSNELINDVASSEQFRFDMEKEMVMRANLIFGANPIICSRFPRSKTMLLPQTVNTHLFCTQHPIADDMPQNGKPTAGFSGQLDESVDFQMLYYTALNLPDWNFVFIGPKTAQHDALFALDNVFYLGNKSQVQKPQYSQHWQVSLLPFKTDKDYVCGFKPTLLEYLAVGVPIISTHADDASHYAKYINVVDTAHEMSQTLKLVRYDNSVTSDVVFGDSCQAQGRFLSNALRNL